ncbi:MAG: hypothetical protein Q9160_004616 [Pyrenula sp. 1 TL-2023]
MGLVSTIRNHFRPEGYQNWRPHHTSEEANARNHEQGVVVEIGYLQPGPVTREHLERWEQGFWGPLIA